MADKRNDYLLRIPVFSGLGIFACLLLVNYTNLPAETVAYLNTWWAYLFFAVVFNITGWAIVRLSIWINTMYMLGRNGKMRFAFATTAVAVFMLGINYALLVSAKMIAGAASPMSLPNGGVRILLLVWLVELAVIGLLSANNALKETMRLQKMSAALQKENDAAKYAALQNQLNPHFLFNSLNTLMAEIEYDPHGAVEFTAKLSEVYRYVLQSQQKRLVTISEELQFAEAYLYLHKVRLGDHIRYSCTLDKEYMPAMIPPLTLQLLLENVLKHNVVSSSHPVTIILSADKDSIVISNTLYPRRSDSSTGVGLKNLDNRCRMATGRGIEVTKTYTHFSVKVPVCYE